MVCLALLPFFFGGDDHRQAPPLPVWLAPVGEFNPSSKKFFTRMPRTDRSREAARNSYVAQVVSAGIIEYDGVARWRRSVARSSSSQRTQGLHIRDVIQLKGGLGSLTIGSTAPFIVFSAPCRNH